MVAGTAAVVVVHALTMGNTKSDRVLQRRQMRQWIWSLPPLRQWMRPWVRSLLLRRRMWQWAWSITLVMTFFRHKPVLLRERNILNKEMRGKS